MRQAFRKYLECGIFAQGPQTHCPGAAQMDKAALHIGAIAFIPARGPPLWDDCDAQTVEGVAVEQDWALAAQPAPALEADQRIDYSATLAGRPWFARGSKPVPGCNTTARVVEWRIRFFKQQEGIQ